MILVANFVTALVARVLSLAAVFDAPGLILGKVVAGSSCAANIGCARSSQVGSSRPADIWGSGSPKVHSGTASARNWVGGSIAGTNLSVADVGAIRAASRELRRYSYPRAESCAAQSRATCR